MALEYKDRVADATTTTGTGTITLAGSAPAGFRTFASAGFTDGATVRYNIFNSTLTEWEVGEGIWTASGTTLSRATVYASSNSGSAVNFSSGTKFVRHSPVAADVAPMFRKNAIINGDFNIWQRGTSFAVVANLDYLADRWRYNTISGVVHAVSRSADVPTVAQAGRLFNYSLLADCTTADTSIAASERSLLVQSIEGFNFLPLAQRVTTLSFWVKATKTGIYCAALRNSVGDRSCVLEYTVNATNTWEKKTLTFPASPSAGTWDYTTGVGVFASFALAAGTDWQTTAGAWQTGNFVATSNQVNACDSTANDFRITGVQLEAGSVATEFEYRTFQDELALCQRYYHRSAPGAVSGLLGYAYAVSSTTGSIVVTPPVPLRTAPGALEQSGTATDYRVSIAGVSTNLSAVPTFGASTTAYSLQANFAVASGLTAGQAGICLLSTSVSTGYLGWSAEL